LIAEAVNAGYGAKSAQIVGDRLLITAKKMEKIFQLLTELDYQTKTVEFSLNLISKITGRNMI